MVLISKIVRLTFWKGGVVGKNFETIFKEFADSETFVLSRGLLEDYKRQAAQAERDRIVTLLRDWMQDDDGDFDVTFAQIVGDK